MTFEVYTPRQKSAAHGTYSRYARKKDPCRCELCTEATRLYRAAQRDTRLAWLTAHPDDEAHGRRASYDAGCRCARCSRKRREVGN